MVTIRSIILILTAILLNTAYANERERGEFGGMIGAPTALTGKFYTSSENSVDFALGVYATYRDETYLHGDYLFERPTNLIPQSKVPMYIHYGLGGRFSTIRYGKNDGKTLFGVRAPLGIDFKFSQPNVTLFGELAMNLDLAPETDVSITGAIGLRIRF